MSGKLQNIDKFIIRSEYLLKKQQRKIDENKKRTDMRPDQLIVMGEQQELVSNVQLLIKEYHIERAKNWGKIPPQAVDMEEAVIGALILEAGRVYSVKESEIIGEEVNHRLDVFNYMQPEHFHVPAHRELFTAMLEMRKEEVPIDMRSVNAWLRKKGVPEPAEGSNWGYLISSIASKVSSVGNIHYHARIVIEHAIRRRIIELGSRMMSEGYDNTSDALKVVDDFVEDFKQIKSWTEK